MELTALPTPPCAKVRALEAHTQPTATCAQGAAFGAALSRPVLPTGIETVPAWAATMLCPKSHRPTSGMTIPKEAELRPPNLGDPAIGRSAGAGSGDRRRSRPSADGSPAAWGARRRR